MLSSRAGLDKTVSPRLSTYPSLLRTAAVLLFTISLSMLAVQAAPVPTHSTSLASVEAFSGSDLAAGASGSYGAAAHISHGETHGLAQSEPLNSAFTGSPHHQKPTHPSGLTAREEVEMVVLVRRKSIAAKIRAAFHKVGHAIKHAFQKVGQGIKHVAQKVGQGIKHAAQKVGHFIKTTGAKIAKVGLKIVATVQKVAAKVVGWLPGIGKPLGKIMEGESEGLNKASDAIHAHIGGKLGQAMHRMDKAQKVVGYIPRSVIPDGSEFEEREYDDFEERGFGDDITERSWDDEEVYLF
ncbi:hypothetical protein D9619_011215 [Psilocybe cf. subviscida]|uniref:Uncharacterized protein n=1 Tax=Psilocybe cf. subviscida TaxID=2480587 RepID=A0A8H5F582_9AGAR|nr:hypothetical protein D9619_011215 [Psilocybe cf. subviscida]